MMLVRAWLLGVIACAVLVSAAQSLTDGGALRRAVRFAGGLLLMLAMLRPLPSVEFPVRETALDGYRAAVEELERELSAQREESLSGGIAAATAAYIEDKADELGASVRASVTVEEKDGVPLPVDVTLYGQRSEVLAAYLADELGITEEHQTWIASKEDGSG